MLAAQARIGGRVAAAADDPLVDRPSDLAPARDLRALRARGDRVLPATGDGVDARRIARPRPAAGIAARTIASVVDWPPAYRAWARQQGLLVSTAADARTEHAACRPRTRHRHARARGRAERLRIVNPPPGATYLFDPTLRARVPDPAPARGHGGERGPAGLGGGRTRRRDVGRGPRSGLAARPRRAHGRGQRRAGEGRDGDPREVVSRRERARSARACGVPGGAPTRRGPATFPGPGGRRGPGSSPTSG